MYMYFSSIAIWKRQECISHVHCVLAHSVAPQTGRAVAVRASDCSAWSPAGKLLEMLKVIVRSANVHVDPDGVTFIFCVRMNERASLVISKEYGTFNFTVDSFTRRWTIEM